MKPRLIKFHGIWHCAYTPKAIGLGYTPVDAYLDWLKYYEQ